MLTARAPAKLIISGEHSVLYGQPALAMAINRYTTTTTTWCDATHIHFNLLNLAFAKSYTVEALKTLTAQLQQNYADFLHGKLNIREVLKRPFELLQCAVTNLFERSNIQLSKGIEIAVDSTIPLGCGMGSSAAAIISTLYALNNFLGLHWQRADYLSFAQEIENLQHGKSSGLDLHLAIYGGYVKYQHGQSELRTAPTMPLQIINTGTPLSSTGECVTTAAKQFTTNPGLATEFGNVTDAIDNALLTNDLAKFKTAIQQNHQLLIALGVVPDKIVNFVADIEAHGGAAKICGAGAINGDNAGVMLLATEHDLTHIVHKHGYDLQTIQVDSYGTQLV